MAKKKVTKSAPSRKKSSRSSSGEPRKSSNGASGTATRKKSASKKKTTRKKTMRKAASTAKGNGSSRKKKTSKSGKTYLSAKELMDYKKLLLVRRAELLGDIESISEEALRAESTDLSHMPIHMADVGSDNHGKELMLGLAESERRTIREIDHALQRIVDRTYGICEATGKRINKARLNAKPWARYCIEAAREMERRSNNHF